MNRDARISGLLAEANILYGNTAIRAEAIEISEEFLPIENELLERAEAAAPAEARAQRWWR